MSEQREGFIAGVVRRLFRRGQRPPPDEPEGGAGVLVPAGPKPRRGGAAASISPKPR